MLLIHYIYMIVRGSDSGSACSLPYLCIRTLKVLYYTNMTSLWGCQHDCFPRVSIVTQGRSPRLTMLTRGRLSCWQPHMDVIFVLLYRTPPLTPGRFTVLTMLGCHISLSYRTTNHLNFTFFPKLRHSRMLFSTIR